MLSHFRCLVKIFCLLTLLGLITQCTNVDRNHTARPLKSPYSLSANAYIAMAENHSGEEKEALLLLAAGRLLDEGNWEESRRILTQINATTVINRDRKALLQAKIDLMRKKPDRALKNLSSIKNISEFSLYDKAQYHESLALTYKKLGRPLEAIHQRMRLESVLPESSTRDNNRRALWLALISLPRAELNTIVIEAPEHSAEKGWATLALIARKNPGNPNAMLAHLAEWDETFPKHPARTLLPRSLDAMSAYLFKRPQQIALVLPLSGPLSGPGHAVQDGFMAALRAKGRETSTTLRLYDTHKLKAKKAYQQAVADGADFIIGPLSKKNVAKVASLQHPVPTLLLNNVGTRTDDHAYQFGLSPVNEARQVAVRARQAGLSRTLIIAPSGSWGDDVLQAFSGEWQRNRGQVVDVMRFDPDNTETLNEDIRNLLQAVPDDERKRQLKVLAKDPKREFGPLRREDFDMIFLLAYPSNARQVMPLLRYYYAGKVPVYATSSIYTGTQNTIADRDLDGIIFCDMPWVFKHPEARARNWPEGFNSYTRLYALGMDSFALSTELNALMLFPALGTDNQTGALYLSQDHQISRILPFGQFNAGVATIL